MGDFNGTKDSLSELTDIFDEIQDSLEDKVSVHRNFLTKFFGAVSKSCFRVISFGSGDRLGTEN